MRRKSSTTPASARSDARLLNALHEAGHPERAAHAQGYFRTGPGDYGEGDQFLGITAPTMRALIKPFYGQVDLDGLHRLLMEPWHEARTAALLLLVHEACRAAKEKDIARLDELEAFYDAHLDRVNNWDLVDISATDFMAACWNGREDAPSTIRRRLDTWADSGHLWRERVAMVSTHALIRRGELAETFRLAARFRDHPHDLIHKAAGWMLREAGKKDMDALRAFLKKWTPELPRTALRYAIERMAPDERQQWMTVPSKKKARAPRRKTPPA